MLWGAVLAGGRSSRMGQDKALLQFEGQSLLERAITFLQGCGCHEVLVSGRPEHPRGVSDLLPECGPPGALLSLLSHLKAHDSIDGNLLLLIPVDMPLLQPRLAAALLDNNTAQCRFYAEEIFPCVVPTSMRLLLHLEYLFKVEKKTGGARSMRAIFEFLAGLPLKMDEPDRELFANVNTPEQWQAVNRSA